MDLPSAASACAACATTFGPMTCTAGSRAISRSCLPSGPRLRFARESRSLRGGVLRCRPWVAAIMNSFTAARHSPVPRRHALRALSLIWCPSHESGHRGCAVRRLGAERGRASRSSATSTIGTAMRLRCGRAKTAAGSGRASSAASSTARPTSTTSRLASATIVSTRPIRSPSMPRSRRRRLRGSGRSTTIGATAIGCGPAARRNALDAPVVHLRGASRLLAANPGARTAR